MFLAFSSSGGLDDNRLRAIAKIVHQFAPPAFNTPPDIWKSRVHPVCFMHWTRAGEEGEERLALMRVYDALLPLIEALHIINEQNKLRAGSHHMPMHPDIAKYNAPKFLEEAEQNNPMIVVRRFCRQFSLVYLRRELHCFVHAAVAMQQNYPEHFSPSVALRVYDEVLALVEAAYVLSAEED